MHTTISLDTTGANLRRARELAMLRERQVTRALGVRRVRLREWEAGEVTPDTDELMRLVNLYSADLGQGWADRRPLTEQEIGVLVIGTERIDVRPGAWYTAEGITDTDNWAVLTHYLSVVRRQRKLSPAEPIKLRSDDLAGLCTVLDLRDPTIETDLMVLLDMTPAGARWATRVMILNALLTLAQTSAIAESWFAGTDDDLEALAGPEEAHVGTPTPFAAPDADAGAERAELRFTPIEAAPDAPIEAQVVSSAPLFSTDPGVPVAEPGGEVFTIAPAAEWADAADAAGAAGELPPAS